MYVKEAMIENYLVKKVREVGGKAIKLNPHNERGLPDRMCVFPRGVIIFVEVKAPGKKPRKNQVKQLQIFKALGHHAVWLDTKTKVDRLLVLYRDILQSRKKQLCVRRQCPMRLNTV